jgi:hypothetical protein
MLKIEALNLKMGGELMINNVSLEAIDLIIKGMLK